MSYRILDDESFDSVRVGQDHAKADGATVILHVESEVGETERFGEAIHYFRDVIESVREFVRVRPVAVTEAWVIGRDKVIAIGKTGEEGLKHSRRPTHPANPKPAARGGEGIQPLPRAAGKVLSRYAYTEPRCQES